MTCQVPVDEKARKTAQDLQSHKCTKTCRKKGPECRFGFPKLPSNTTIFLHQVNNGDKDQVKNLKLAKETLRKMRTYLEDEDNDRNKSLEQILRELDIPLEKYENAFEII